MRRAVSSITLLLTIASCTAFGAKSDSNDNSTPPPQTPDQNAQPPIQGAPLTGIFASSSKGADATSGADGSMDHPYKTLKDAIALAASAGQRVIACAEEYDEAVVLPDGVSMYGYYDCTQAPWARANAHAVVKSPTSPALTIKDAPHPMRIDGFEIDAPNLDAAPAVDPSKASSIAAWVSNTPQVTFGSDVLNGGNGAPGIDGTEGPPNQEQGSPNGGSGYIQSDCSYYHPSPSLICFGRSQPGTKTGPKGGTSKCAMGGSGGAGGDGGMGATYPDWDGTGSNPCSGSPPAGFVSQGGAPTASTSTAQGVGYNELPASSAAGPDGGPGAEGADGANGVWKLDAAGFHPGDGTKGGNGNPGQGGGGSGGDFLHFSSAAATYADDCPASAFSGFETATGASGGAGGCGGIPGSGGTGGGASIGILIVNSGVTFEEGAIQSAAGGRAGKGTLGSSGLAGGTGGGALPVPQGATRNGGHGGAGGSGGLSGHGAPGPSFAIAYSGNAPTVGNATRVLAGAGGVGQAALQKTSNGKTHSLPAVTGVSQAEYQF